MGTAYGPLCRVYQHLRTVLVAQHLGILVDDGAGCFCRAREPSSVFEGVQMSAARIDEPCKIPVASYVRVSLLAIHHAYLLVGVFLVQLAAPLAKFLHMAGFQGYVHMVRLVVAIDG